MKLLKCFGVAAIFLASAVAFAGECDFCVCKGDDTQNSCTACCREAARKGLKLKEEKLSLHLSPDGTALLDQEGNEIARFTKGTIVKLPAKGAKAASEEKLQGCFRCYYTCVVYDGDRCIQKVRTCDWDFDC